MIETVSCGGQVSAAAVVGALSAVIRAEHRHAAFLAPAIDLGLNEVLALYHLANEPLTAGGLHNRVGLSTGSVTALIDRLAHLGLVERRPHRTDRRAADRTTAVEEPVVVARGGGRRPRDHRGGVPARGPGVRAEGRRRPRAVQGAVKSTVSIAVV